MLLEALKVTIQGGMLALQYVEPLLIEPVQQLLPMIRVMTIGDGNGNEDDDN